MSIAGSASATRYLPKIRAGRLIVPLAVVAAVVAAVILLVKPMMRGSEPDDASRVVVQKIERGTFEHNVIEPGELESSNNVEVRCEVEARNSSGTVILEVVPNGAEVNVGDFLVRFDSSALEQERNQQQITVNDATALVIQSKTALETAEISKKEYVEGTFTQEEQLLLGELFVAEENLRRAEEYARYSERLAAKGYVTSDQVEADRFAVEKGKNDVAAVNTKLKVLREYTRAKMLKTLDAGIETAKGKLASDEFTLKLAQDKLDHLDEQIKKCVVHSPAAGKVVYANRTDRRGGSEVIIEEGAVIRERQPVIRLPDLNKMQAVAKVNETRVSHVRKGMKAKASVDAFPGMKLDGEVVRVDEYPAPPSWFSQNIKQYATYIALDNPPAGIRPGLTVQVEINVDSIPNSLKAPIQAVVERDGEYYCVVRKGSSFEPKWIDIGPTNDQEVLIRAGVEEGEEVVLDPEPMIAKAELPKAPLGYWESHPRYERLVGRSSPSRPPEKTPSGVARPTAALPIEREKNGMEQAERPAAAPADAPPTTEKPAQRGRPRSASGAPTATNSAG
ncbi:MAG: HlyD family efflux transporter periplasmic adaptor subunit [Pirellulales bacterium]|nr:HlyD family efflux transporter periplasmic adaptor subunit [Pirellulales bacterium]